MKHTKEQYQEALEQFAIHAEGWKDNALSLCEMEYKCPKTGYE